MVSGGNDDHDGVHNSALFLTQDLRVFLQGVAINGADFDVNCQTSLVGEVQGGRVLKFTELGFPGCGLDDPEHDEYDNNGDPEIDQVVDECRCSGDEPV